MPRNHVAAIFAFVTIAAGSVLTAIASQPSESFDQQPNSIATQDRAVAARATKNADRTIESHLAAMVREFHMRSDIPGVTVGYVLPDGTNGSVSAGMADVEGDRAMTGEDRMMAGSTGKTLWAAAALLLVEDGALDLDAPISTWLGDEPWFDRLPNSADITCRMLLNHTAGIPRYVMLPDFTAAVAADPQRRWQWHELISYVLDMPAPFKAGEGWAYADTNFIVLGMVIEKLTGDSFLNLVYNRILRHNKLWDLVPATSPDIPGIACGYINAQRNLFRLDTNRVIDTGRFVFNPHFERAGGGFASTPRELARWADLLYDGDVLSAESKKAMRTGVDSPMLGGESTYGLGVMMRPSQNGPVLGHDGFFPGFLTSMVYYEKHDIALVVQVNTNVQSRAFNSGTMGQLLDRCAGVIVADAQE